MGFKSSFITFFFFFLLIFRYYLLFGYGYQRSHIVLLNLRLFTHLSSFYLSLISLVPFKNNLNLDSFLYLMSRNHVFVLILSSFWFFCLFLSLLIMHDMKLCLLFTYWILDFFFFVFIFSFMCHSCLVHYLYVFPYLLCTCFALDILIFWTMLHSIILLCNWFVPIFCFLICSLDYTQLLYCVLGFRFCWCCYDLYVSKLCKFLLLAVQLYFLPMFVYVGVGLCAF